MRTSRNIRAEMLELNMRLGRDIAAKDRIRKIDSLNPSMCRSPPSKRLAVSRMHPPRHLRNLADK